MCLAVFYFIEDDVFSVGQLQFSTVQTPAEQTQHLELPFLQPRANVSRVQFTCSFQSLFKDLPSDLNTVVFSLRAGFAPFTTSPSSANTSAWKYKKWVMRLGRSLVLSQTPADWPLRGWHHQTLPSLPLYCRHTPTPPSSARHPAHASLACKLLLLLSRRGIPLVNHPTHKQI